MYHQLYNLDVKACDVENITVVGKVVTITSACLTALAILYWLFLQIYMPESSIYYTVFTFFLIALPLLGIINGILIQKAWGGFESFVGRSVICTSAGLMMWALGMGISTYLEIANHEIPYPGIPDYFFVLIDPLYALSLVSIMRFSGARTNMKRVWALFLLFTIPLISIFINFKIFFGSTDYFETIDYPVVFNIIYTFGSVLVMILAVLTIVLSITRLGGKMRLAIYMLFLGIVLQYMGDITYSILLSKDSLYSGNLSDFIYFLSIAFVTIGLSRLNTDRLNGGNGISVDNGVVS